MQQPRWGAPAAPADSDGDAPYVAFESSLSDEAYGSGSESESSSDSGSDGRDGPSASEDGATSLSSSEEGEDMTPGGRYFLGRDGGPRCFACGHAGHVSRDCPSRGALPCVLCGGVGHGRDACPEEVCHNCLGAGHVSRACPEPWRRRAAPTDECAACGLRGHLRRECSLHWRRYRLAVRLDGPGALTEAGLSRALRTLARSCYHCAAPTHFGDECPQRFDAADRTAFRRPDMRFLALASGVLPLGHAADQSEPARRVSHFGKHANSAGGPWGDAASRTHERALGHAQPAHMDYGPRRGRGGAPRGSSRGSSRGAPRGAHRHVSYRPPAD